MQTNHAIALQRAPRLTTQRATGLFFAGLLQVALIWALIEGLNIKVWPTTPPPLTGEIIKDNTKYPPPPPPLDPTIIEPAANPATPPRWDTLPDPDAHPITPDNGPRTVSADFGPSGVRGTHTIPPNPLIAIRLGEAGTVRLHLTISPQGVVTEATIVRSSGYDDLDRAAQSWVLTHWRYHPASHAGTPVPGAADAEVLFDLQNAH